MPRHLPNLFGEAPQVEGFAILIGDGEGRLPSSAPSEVLLSTLCRNRAAKVCSMLFGFCLVTIVYVLLALETMGQTVTTSLSLPWFRTLPALVRPFLHPKGPSLISPSNSSSRRTPSAPTLPNPLIPTPSYPPPRSSLYPAAVKDAKAEEKKKPEVLPREKTCWLTY